MTHDLINELVRETYRGVDTQGGSMTFTEKERTMSAYERAQQAGYDARYEGKPIEAVAEFTARMMQARAWHEGWQRADEELASVYTNAVED